MMKSPITTHILDTAQGKPAAGVPITLYRHNNETWQELSNGVTNNDGRIPDLLEPGRLQTGTYRIVFDTKNYFKTINSESFYPAVQVEFTINDSEQHYHVPLLLSPFGYSTYKGS